MDQANDEVDRALVAEFSADLEGLNDAQIDLEIDDAQSKLDEVEPWLEALTAEKRIRAAKCNA